MVGESRNYAGPRSSRTQSVKEGPMLEFVTAPGDCSDPALAALLDQEELARQVELFFHSHWNLASVEAIQAQVLRLHTGKRCTLEITLKNGDTLHDLIGKTFTEPRHDICEYLRELWRAGFDRNSKFSTPQAFAYVPSLRLLLQEKVHGLSVREVFLGGDWDTYDQAAPARDLARFIVATERLALGHLRSIRALEPMAEVFLETYVAERGAAALPRLPFYKATMCLKLAKHCAFSPRVRRSAKKVEAMLDEGIRVLGN